VFAAVRRSSGDRLAVKVIDRALARAFDQFAIRHELANLKGSDFILSLYL